MAALIEESALEEYLEIKRSTGKDMLPGLIELYSNDAPKKLMSIVVYLRVGDFEKVGVEAHSLKSSSASLGAKVVQEYAAKIEKLILKEGIKDSDQIKPLVMELHHVMLPTINELNSLFGHETCEL